MTIQNDMKRQIMATLDTLPEHALEDVVSYLGYLQYKLRPDLGRATPYKPVALGGLWAGVRISDEDIAEMRREMWGTFGERDL